MNDRLKSQHGRVPEGWWDERSEAFEAWADRVSAADLEPADTRSLQAITRLTDLRKEIEAAILEAVRQARRAGHTWSEIGAMLGVSKQAAQHKFGPADPGASRIEPSRAPDHRVVAAEVLSVCGSAG